ncbi:MAG TPA: hypothetical protein VGE51_15160 [Fontimonas sp.]
MKFGQAIRMCAVAGVTLAVTACATTTPYQPREGKRGYGYSEQMLESNRYRVNYTGNASTPRETVENYLLYRAAELTLQHGYNYFKIAQQDTDRNTEYRQSFSGGYGGFYGGYYRWGPTFGLGASTTTSESEYEAQAMILMFKGAKPADDAGAFDANEVRQNLQPLIIRPQPK